MATADGAATSAAGAVDGTAVTKAAGATVPVAGAAVAATLMLTVTGDYNICRVCRDRHGFINLFEPCRRAVTSRHLANID